MRNLIYVILAKKANLTIFGYSESILSKYRQKFDKIYVFCIGKHKKSQEKNIYYFEGNLFNWFSDFFKLKKKHIKFVAINDWFIGGFIGTIFSKIIKKPLVMRCGSMWLYEINHPIKLLKLFIRSITKPLVLHSCKNIVFNSKSIIQKSTQQKSKVVHNGVDIELFKPMNNKSSKKLRVLFIGRICSEKGLDYLFESTNKIKDKIELTIVGLGENLNEYKIKFPWAKYLGLIKHNELYKTINKNDLLILPSLSNSAESFPSTILEAMACEKPVIASNIRGIPEVIKNNYNGILIPEKNSEAITKAILKLKNKKLRETLGKKARETIMKNFKLNPQINKLYNSLFI